VGRNANNKSTSRRFELFFLHMYRCDERSLMSGQVSARFIEDCIDDTVSALLKSARMGVIQ
jgi:hypothetical protein